MTLADQILDEARALAENRILYYPTDAAILDVINEIVGIKLGERSIGAKLAIAQYRRWDNIIHQIDELVAA